MYSEEQLYQLIGEKNSMKRLLTEVRGSDAPPPLAALASPLPFCGLKALQGEKPFLTPRSTLVLTFQPLPSGQGRAALFCHITLHPKVLKIRHDPEGLKKKHGGGRAGEPGFHIPVKHG